MRMKESKNINQENIAIIADFLYHNAGQRDFQRCLDNASFLYDKLNIIGKAKKIHTLPEVDPDKVIITEPKMIREGGAGLGIFIAVFLVVVLFSLIKITVFK